MFGGWLTEPANAIPMIVEVFGWLVVAILIVALTQGESRSNG
jgi:hypothetical protein